MDVVERLTLEAAQADTMLAAEHRHRYEFAAAVAQGTRVLDLCCGSGYGSAMLAGVAASVLGVDRDLATIETARATVGVTHANVSFEAADAVAFLESEAAAGFDLIVCFEGLEHLERPEAAVTALAGLAERGARLLLSLPNDKLTGAQNPFHVTMFGYDEAVAVAARLPGAVLVVPQFLAEGSLLVPEGASEIEVGVDLLDRREPEYANHFIICVGFTPDEVGAAVRGRMHLAASPIFNRWSEGLKHGIAGLARENARLARRHLGRGGSAAAAAVARQDELAEQVRGLRHELRAAQDLLAESEAERSGTGSGQDGVAAGPWSGVPAQASTGRPPQAALAQSVVAEPALGLVFAPGEDPNSWENRRLRAARFLLPWIEATVPLAGKTVLEYGCGNGAVSLAVAERAGRLIGLDIDADGIGEGRRRAAAEGVDNVELELHPVETILERMAGLTGQVDMVLLYAVLEHLTLEERLAVLGLAREVVAPDGAIVVCETPNRLIAFDHHTGQMPYLHSLDLDLALRYYPRSQRGFFTQAIDAAVAEGGAEAGQHALIRWGRGVSFHEFEVVFGDLAGHVLASSYDLRLFGERPVHPEDVSLSRYLGRLRPDLAPNWSRYWLDVILSPEPVGRRPALLTPWVADTSRSVGVGWTAWETVAFTHPGAVLNIDLPQPTQRVVLGSRTREGHAVSLTLRGEAGDLQAISHRAGPDQQAYASVSFSAPTRRLSVQTSASCELVFVGYDA